MRDLAVHHSGLLVDAEAGRVYRTLRDGSLKEAGKSGTIWVGGRRLQSSRVIWEASMCPIPDGAVVRHKNGDPSDKRIQNLTLGNLGRPRPVNSDAYGAECELYGKDAIRKRNDEIRQRFAANPFYGSRKLLAQQYGLTYGMIYRILKEQRA